MAKQNVEVFRTCRTWLQSVIPQNIFRRCQNFQIFDCKIQINPIFSIVLPFKAFSMVDRFANFRNIWDLAEVIGTLKDPDGIWCFYYLGKLNWEFFEIFLDVLKKFLGCLHLFFKLPPNLSAMFLLVIFMIMGCLIFWICRCFDVPIQCNSALLEFERLQKTAFRKIRLTPMFFEISSSVETLSVVN